MTDAVEAREGVGLGGDVPAIEESTRQVLLMEQETLTARGLQPGALKENITTQGLLLISLKRGQQLQIGDAILQITGPYTTCSRLEEVRSGFQEALRDRREMLARVTQGGLIRIGGPIYPT